MNKFTTDPSQRLDLYFRVNSNGVPIALTFVNSDGSNYSFIYDEFQLVIKPYVGAQQNTIVLGLGTGLTLTDNVLTIVLDLPNTNIDPGEYYWELIKNDYGRPWLTGIAYAIDGNLPVITQTETITVNEAGYNITITISEGSTTTSTTNTPSYADQETIMGEGTQDDPFHVPEGLYDAYGAAAVVMKYALPRAWDNSQNKFPDSGGSGEDEAIEAGNYFIGTGTGSWIVSPEVGAAAETVNRGARFRAIIDNPGNDPANWFFWG
jgi:hypothetical protein